MWSEKEKVEKLSEKKTKKDNFKKEFLKLTEYDPRISTETAEEVYDIGLHEDVMEVFKKYGTKKAIEELNERGVNGIPPRKEYEFSISKTVMGNYIKFKKY